MSGIIIPVIGDMILINKKYFEDNAFVAQYFPNLKPGVPYIVDSVKNLSGTPLGFGVDILSEPNSGEVFDINQIPELDDYWCLIDSGDSYRVVPQ